MPEFTEDMIALEWSYTPKTFLEEPYEAKRDDYDLKIADGTVTATFPAAVYDRDQGVLERIHEELDLLFCGFQVNVRQRQRYKLSRYSMQRWHANGQRSTTVFAGTALLSMTVYPVDVIVRDAAGNVVADTKRDRVQEQRGVAELATSVAISDPIAKFILERYRASLNDPAKALVHLYDIRDALATRFRGEDKARERLSLDKTTDWGRLGKIANFMPLREGRHQGWHVEDLRDATVDELEEAKSIARKMILAYLALLDRGETP